jgi:RNA polymerase sigma factor (sigma-70 family)
MNPQAGYPVAGEKRDASGDYRRLLAALVSRAVRLGSRDPESAAQEALRRSLENPNSQPAIKYYFSQDLPASAQPPEWPLDQLFAWLYGVLHYVVREEQHRSSFQREVASALELDPPDRAPNQVDALIRKEFEGIVVDCVRKLDPEYQAVLRMRGDGLKYGEIASRMGVNENTVATWVSRAIRTLGQHVRRRTEHGARS